MPELKLPGECTHSTRVFMVPHPPIPRHRETGWRFPYSRADRRPIRFRGRALRSTPPRPHWPECRTESPPDCERRWQPEPQSMPSSGAARTGRVRFAASAIYRQPRRRRTQPATGTRRRRVRRRAAGSRRGQNQVAVAQPFEPDRKAILPVKLTVPAHTAEVVVKR